jgi:hypothetical protein
MVLKGLQSVFEKTVFQPLPMTDIMGDFLGLRNNDPSLSEGPGPKP